MVDTSLWKGTLHIFMHKALSVRAWQTFGFVPLQKCKKSKQKNCGFGDATRDGNEFIFFNCMWTLPQRKHIYRQVCDQSCVAVLPGGLAGKQTVWLLMHERMHLSFERLVRRKSGDPCWPATSWELFARRGDARGFTICTVKAQLCFVKRTRLWKVSRPRFG